MLFSSFICSIKLTIYISHKQIFPLTINRIFTLLIAHIEKCLSLRLSDQAQSCLFNNPRTRCGSYSTYIKPTLVIVSGRYDEIKASTIKPLVTMTSNFLLTQSSTASKQFWLLLRLGSTRVMRWDRLPGLIL